MICIDADDTNPSSNGENLSLQERFAAMRARKIAAAARVKASKENATTARSAADKEALRARFVEAVRSYIGTPYSTQRCAAGAPLYLDCCGLVRKALLDLKEDFGFEIGPWNQAYLYDTLPKTIEPEELQPGDLIFWQADLDNPDKWKNKPRHDLVHVEVFVGPHEGTIGSRYEGDAIEFKGVDEFNSYMSFGGHGCHNHRLTFKSIDAWLDGVCVSHCAECSWGEVRSADESKHAKSRLFEPTEAMVAAKMAKEQGSVGLS